MERPEIRRRDVVYNLVQCSCPLMATSADLRVHKSRQLSLMSFVKHCGHN